MHDTARTRPSLLLRIRDAGDREAWSQFVHLYGPLIYHFARKRHLQDADAADLTQVVLQAVAGAVERLNYDPERGSFRGWLFQIVRHHLWKRDAQQRRSTRGSGDSDTQRLLESLPGREEEAAAWDREHDRQLFLWAAERVRAHFAESGWQAFWQTSVEGQAPRDVARALGMSVGAVYTAKSRVLDRLRREVRQVESDESGDG
jgi:RNA polymerase sigma factor (sigma-70 family)